MLSGQTIFEKTSSLSHFERRLKLCGTFSPAGFASRERANYFWCCQLLTCQIISLPWSKVLNSRNFFRVSKSGIVKWHKAKEPALYKEICTLQDVLSHYTNFGACILHFKSCQVFSIIRSIYYFLKHNDTWRIEIWIERSCQHVKLLVWKLRKKSPSRIRSRSKS